MNSDDGNGTTLRAVQRRCTLEQPGRWLRRGPRSWLACRGLLACPLVVAGAVAGAVALGAATGVVGAGGEARHGLWSVAVVDVEVIEVVVVVKVIEVVVGIGVVMAVRMAMVVVGVAVVVAVVVSVVVVVASITVVVGECRRPGGRGDGCRVGFLRAELGDLSSDVARRPRTRVFGRIREERSGARRRLTPPATTVTAPAAGSAATAL